MWHILYQTGRILYFMSCRPETKLWSPQVMEEGKAHPFKVNLEAEQQVRFTMQAAKSHMYNHAFLLSHNVTEASLCISS